MQFLKRIFLNPLVIFLIIGFIAISLIVQRNNVNPFTLQLIDQEAQAVTLAKYLGHKPLILNFWASWCPHCQNEVAILNKLQAKYPNINIIGIQVDEGTASHIFNTANYTILHAPITGNTMMSQLGNSMGAVPYIIFLNSNGKVVDSATGETSLVELENIIAKLKHNQQGF
jgi:thiol-disulfide isomerase/thioredoxin